MIALFTLQVFGMKLSFGMCMLENKLEKQNIRKS